MCAFLSCPTHPKSAKRAKKYFNYTCHWSHHHFSKHYISSPIAHGLACLCGISASLHAATTAPRCRLAGLMLGAFSSCHFLAASFFDMKFDGLRLDCTTFRQRLLLALLLLLLACLPPRFYFLLLCCISLLCHCVVFSRWQRASGDDVFN